MSDVSPPPVEWTYDYVQTGKPADAEEGESWYDMDDDRALVFTDDSGGTRELTVTEHAQLAGITRDAHHNPVSVEGPLRLSSGQVLDLAAADGLTLDADGRLRVAAGSVTEAMLGFSPAMQSDIDNHESDTDAHHSRFSGSEARQAVDGSDVDIEGDARTVGGKTAADLTNLLTVMKDGRISDITWSGGVSSRQISNNNDTAGKESDVMVQLVSDKGDTHTIHTYEAYNDRGPFIVSFSVTNYDIDGNITEIHYRLLKVQ